MLLLNLVPESVWDVISSFLGHHDARVKFRFYGCCRCIAVRGDRIATGHELSVIVVWSYRESKEDVTLLEGHKSFINSVAFMHENSDRLISTSNDYTLRVWDVRTATCCYTLDRFGCSVLCLSSVAGKFVSGSADHRLKLWDTTTLRCVKTLEGRHQHFVTSAAIDGDILVSGSYDSTVMVWCLKSGKWLSALEGHDRIVKCVAICGDTIASGSFDKKVKVWSLNSGSCVHTLEGHKTVVTSVAIQGNRMFVSASQDLQLIFWNGKTGECLRTVDNACEKLVLQDDLVIGATSAKTKLIQEDGIVLSTLDNNLVVSGTASLSRDGLFAIPCANVEPFSSYQIAVWDGSRIVKLLQRQFTPIECLHIQNNFVVCCSDDIKLWNVHSGECLRTWQLVSKIHSVVIYNDLLVTGSSTLQIWGLHTGECLKSLHGHSNDVCAVAIQDNIIVSGSFDDTVKIWDLCTGQCLQTLPAKGVQFLGIDKGVLVVGSKQYDATIWDICSGQFLHSVPARFPMCIDNGLLAAVAASQHKEVKLWNLRTNDCVETLEDCADLSEIKTIAMLKRGTLVIISTTKIMQFAVLDINEIIE